MTIQAQTHLERVQEALELTLPLIQQLFPIDVMFALTNTKQFLHYTPGQEIDIHVHPDQKIPPTSGITEALHTGELVSRTIGEEIYGTPFKSNSLPFTDEQGRIIGALTMGISLKNQEILSEATEYLVTSSGEIKSATDEIAVSATEMTNDIQMLKEIGENMVSELHKTDEMLDFIKQVSDNSRLLSINASIEAAHAGDHGRGFGVVATEMRKMADSSATAAKEIEQILSTIQHNIKQLHHTLFHCLDQSERQAAATEEIAASMEQLLVSAEEIQKVSHLL